MRREKMRREQMKGDKDPVSFTVSPCYDRGFQ